MIVEILPRMANIILYTAVLAAESSRQPSGGGGGPKSVRQGLDEIDRRIVLELAHDARIPNNTLAERAGVAPSTCLARVRALRERGVIRGYHADVDPAALGRPLQAMIAVRLTVHHREEIEGFTRAVRELPGVLSVFHVAGVNDYLVWVAAADAQDLREFVVDHLATHPSVAHAETSLIYEHRRGPGPWRNRNVDRRDLQS
jgi:DNA-binding Lrp family transcriptional regulator